MPIIEPQIHEIEAAAFNCYKRGGGDGDALKDWVQAKRFVFIEKNYDVIAHHAFRDSTTKLLQNRSTRCCRYCRSIKPNSVEWKQTYPIPEIVGNKTILAIDECPACNAIFRSLEEELGCMLRLLQALDRIEEKKSVPSLLVLNGGSYTDEKREIIEVEEPADSALQELDQDSDTNDTDDELVPFTPLAVYKCLTKMALAIMPPAYLSKFGHAIDWIKKRDHSVGAAEVAGAAKCRLIFQPGPMPMDCCHCTLLVRKSPDALVPYMLFSLTMSNQTFQIMVPWTACDNHLVGQRFVMPEFPSYYGHGYKFGGPLATTLDLASPVKIQIKAPRRLAKVAMLAN